MLSLLFFSVLAIFGIIRFYSNLQSEKRSNDLLKNLTNENFKVEFSDSLDIEILKKRVNSFDTIKKMLPIERPFKLNNFKINHCYKINDTTYIIATLAEYEDLVMHRSGNRVALNVCDLNFKILIDYNNSNLLIFSDTYTELIDKQLRKTFADIFFEYLVNGNSHQGHFPPEFKKIKNEYSKLTDDELNYLFSIRKELSTEEQDILFNELEYRLSNQPKK